MPFQIGEAFFMSGLFEIWCLLLVMTIAEAYRRFQRVDLRGQVPAIIQMTEVEIIALNHSQLYKQGIDSTGLAMIPYGEGWYRDMKITMNPELGGITDLFLSGDFYSGFFVRTEAGEIIIGSSDSKSTDLEKRYGVSIFGLTYESMEDYTKNDFFVELRNYIEGITKIQMT